MILSAVVSACGSVQATATITPEPMATTTSIPVPTQTAVPSSTPGPDQVWDYVALGDSNPVGVGVIHSYVDIYADYIERDLGVQVRVHNWAFNGAKTAQLLAQLGRDARLQQDVHEAEVITIDIGANDWTSVFHRYPTQMCGGADNQDCLRKLIQSYSENLDSVLNKILELHGQELKLLIRMMDLYMSNCDYPDIYGTPGIFPEIKPYLDQFNTYIDETTPAHSGVVVPLYVTLNGPNGDQNPLDYIQNDQCHLNPNGHRKVADMLRELGYEN